MGPLPYRQAPNPDLGDGVHVIAAVQWFAFSVIGIAGYLIYLGRQQPRGRTVQSRGASQMTTPQTTDRSGTAGTAGTAGTEGAGQGSGTPLVRAQALDHVNLHVRDADASIAFYTDVLGLRVADVDRDAAGRATFVTLEAGPQNVFLMRRPDYQIPDQPAARGLNHICVEVQPQEPQGLLEDPPPARGDPPQRDRAPGGRAGAHGVDLRRGPGRARGRDQASPPLTRLSPLDRLPLPP